MGPRLVPICTTGSTAHRWYIRFQDPVKGKRDISTGCTIGDRAGAELALAKFIFQHAATTVENEMAAVRAKRSDAVTCGQVLTIYAEQHATTTADPQRIGWAIQALLPFWADILVSEVRGETCRRYLETRKKRERIPESHPARYRSVAVSPATVRRELSTLAAALAYCQREGHLLEAPTVWRPPASAPREAYLSRQEVARLIRAARKDARSGRHLALFILLAYYTGRRKEAILTLQWAPNSEGGHVDLEKGVIDFRPTGRVETAKRRGRLEIPDRLLRFLRHARRRTRTHLFEYGPHNRPIRDVKRSFASAARAAGLAPEIVTPHILRHTCISHLAQAGVPLFDACQWVDVTMETAERVYAHNDGRHDRVRNALGQGGRMRRPHQLPPSL